LTNRQREISYTIDCDAALMIFFFRRATKRDNRRDFDAYLDEGIFATSGSQNMLRDQGLHARRKHHAKDRYRVATVTFLFDRAINHDM